MGYITRDNHVLHVGFALSFNLHHIRMIAIKANGAYDVLFIVFGIGFMMLMPSTKTFHHGILHV